MLRVLSVARLVEKKGLDTLLHAAADVPGVRVTIAGDGPMRPELENTAADPRLAGRVTFLGGVDPSAVADLLREHDAVALPCRASADGDRDGIPVALMEAMAGGLPVVAGDLPAIRELVEDGQTGRLVPGGDAAALAGILAQWADDKNLRATLGEAGRGRVEAEFALSANVARLESALRAAPQARA